MRVVKETWIDAMARKIGRRLPKFALGTFVEWVTTGDLTRARIQLRDGGEVISRPLFVGIGVGIGMVMDIEPGTEAVVFIPARKLNHSVAFLGISNGITQNANFPPAGVVLEHTGGVQLGGYEAGDCVATNDRLQPELDKIATRLQDLEAKFIAHNHGVSSGATTTLVPPQLPSDRLTFPNVGSPEVKAT